MDENEIKNVVIQGYRNVLKREPDLNGLSNYINEIKKGLSIERFYHILRTSEEYRQRIGDQSPIVPFYVPPSQNTSNQQSPIIPFNAPTPSQNTPSAIAYCMIGRNKLHEIKDYIHTVLPYVDRFVYIDSGSTDGTIEFLKDLSSKNNNNIDVIVREWQDKFSYFRNFYLEHLRNQNYNGWVLVSDTDEHFPQETLSQLRNLIGGIHSGIQFRSYDITIDDNDRTKIVSQSLSNYWKGLMFKFHQNLRYEGEPHESLVGAPINWKQTDLIYEHKRSQRKIYERACLAPGSLIITSRGLGDIKDINVGDLIYSHDGKFHKVKDVIKRDIDEQIYEIKPHKGLPIKITGDHRVYAIRTEQCSELSKTMVYPCRKGRNLLNCRRCSNKFYKQYKSEWIAIKDLRKEDILVFPKPNTGTFNPGKIISEYYRDTYIQSNDKTIGKSPIKIKTIEKKDISECSLLPKKIELVKEEDVLKIEKKQKEIQIDKDLMRLFGYWLAEGDVYIEDNQIRLSLNINDPLEDIKNIVRNKIGKNVWESIDCENPNTVALRFRDQGLANYLYSTFGKGAVEKIIPITFLGLENEYIINLLKGIILGDGTESNVLTGVTTTSRSIASFVYLALIKLDFHPTLITVKDQKIKYGAYGNSIQYRISIMGNENLRRLRNIFGSNIPIKEVTHTRNIGYNDENYVYMSIQRIYKEDYKGDVYNLEVEESETYCSPIITMHNCENFFISNSNRYSSKWGEFRMLCSKNDMIKFAQFIERYKKGDLPKDIEDWIYDHRNDNENEGDSEVRDMAKLYYEILYPDKKR